ncbi:hypothetical protein GVAV_000559 [Gurleya vavrai]
MHDDINHVNVKFFENGIQDINNKKEKITDENKDFLIKETKNNGTENLVENVLPDNTKAVSETTNLYYDHDYLKNYRNFIDLFNNKVFSHFEFNKIFSLLNNFIIDEKTIFFDLYHNNYIQITTYHIIFENQKYRLQNRAIKCKTNGDFLYVLSENNILTVYNKFEIIYKYETIDFDTINEYLFLLNSKNIEIMNNFKNFMIIQLKKVFFQISVIYTDYYYIILQNNNFFYFYSLNGDKILKLPNHPISTNVKHINLKNKIFIFPNTLLFLYRNEYYLHKIDYNLDFISKNFILSKTSLNRYCLNENIDYYNKYCIKEIKTDENGILIDHDKTNKLFAICNECTGNEIIDNSEHNKNNINKNSLELTENKLNILNQNSLELTENKLNNKKIVSN